MFFSCGLCGQITEVLADGTVKVLSAIHDKDKIDWDNIVQKNTGYKKLSCNCAGKRVLIRHQDLRTRRKTSVAR
jgi:hypothetical protein